MTNIHLFQLFGLLLFSMGLGLLAYPKHAQKMMKGFSDNPAVLYIAGICVLILGYILTTYHNFWRPNRTLIVTIIGWLAIIKGLAILIFPAPIADVVGRIAKNKKFMSSWSWILIVAGIISLYLGYFD